MPGSGRVLPVQLVGKIVAGIVVFMAVAVIAILLSAESLFNGVVKERILRDVNSRKGISLALGTFRYSILANRISCDNLHFTMSGGKTASNNLTLAADACSCSDVNWLRILFAKGFSCGDLVFEGLRGHVTSREDEKAAHRQSSGEHPESPQASQSSMPFIIGRLSASGGEFSHTTHSSSGIVHDSVSRFAVRIENLRFELGSEEHVESALARAHIECEAERVGFQMPGSVYRIGFASGRVSESKSMVEFDSLRITPVLSDGDFFASNHFGSTRYRLAIGRIAAHGLNLPGVLREEKYTARSISIDRPVVNIVVNKRLSSGQGKDEGQRGRSVPDSARMPNELLTRMKAQVHIDSLMVNSGTVEYAELYPDRSKPAALQWSGVRLAAAGISNRKTTADSSARIEASGMFQDTARMVVSMELPLGSRIFSLSCHGVVDALPLTSLNSFLEVAEGIRVTSGRADSIRFALTARNGKSSGTVRPFYRDLEIEMLAKKSGRSDGLAQKVGTMLADITIKDDNLPDGSDGIKEGPIQYVRNPEDPFFRFLWFSLRDGLGKVVGF